MTCTRVGLTRIAALGEGFDRCGALLVGAEWLRCCFSCNRSIVRAGRVTIWHRTDGRKCRAVLIGGHLEMNFLGVTGGGALLSTHGVCCLREGNKSHATC